MVYKGNIISILFFFQLYVSISLSFSLSLVTLKRMSQKGLQANTNNQPKEGVSSPYMSNDPNSNVANFKIIESTLREGEQFANAFFTTEKKIGKEK